MIWRERGGIEDVYLSAKVPPLCAPFEELLMRRYILVGRGRRNVGPKRIGSAHQGWSDGPALADAIGAGVTSGPLGSLPD